MTALRKQISEEEYDRIEGERRHDEVVSLLSQLGTADDKSLRRLESLLAQQGELIKHAVSREAPPDIKPLITEMNNVIKEFTVALNSRPKSFRVERRKDGLIERIIVEK